MNSWTQHIHYQLSYFLIATDVFDLIYISCLNSQRCMARILVRSNGGTGPAQYLESDHQEKAPLYILVVLILSAAWLTF